MYKEIKGDLIALTLSGQFDVIAHGCNCFCTMGAGIAPQMAKTFKCDKFQLEEKHLIGEINKLGCIDFQFIPFKSTNLTPSVRYFTPSMNQVYVVNAYTQYGFGRNHENGLQIPLDYEALTLCMRKINHQFKGKHIGLPQIGCGLAGGDWNRVKLIIQTELKNCDVTVVIYNK